MIDEKQNQIKKVIALIILVIFAVIIWHNKISVKEINVGNINSENPFIDVKEVPLRLEILKVPSIGRKKENKDNEKWGRNPFTFKK